MSVLALVTKLDDVELVVRWSAAMAVSRETSLTVLCWAYAPTAQFPLLEDHADDSATDDLVAKVRDVAQSAIAESTPERKRIKPSDIDIQRVEHPNATDATLEHIRRNEPGLLVMAAPDPTGKSSATYANNPLLRQSACMTVVLYPSNNRPSGRSRVFVMATDSPHDTAASQLASRLASHGKSLATIARVEEGGEEAIELGNRELRLLMRRANVKRHEHIRHRVFVDDDFDGLAAAINKSDLVLVGANNQKWVRGVVAHEKSPTVGVVKQAPPLRLGQRRPGTPWRPMMNPADYADLVQSLRQGSKLNVDFLTMLGLASAIASWGLLQDSPAVVIGSMLLAPLMTPMIAIGLSMAQANPNFGRKSMGSVLVGFFVTLVVSMAVGFFTPGEEITSQVIARGDPNILDLCIAIFSGAAAAYALARPNLVGAVAGVAIATALVPPLCSVGISIAYQNYDNAQGAVLLFVTNVVAIIIGAAITFRLLGVMPRKINDLQRQWVFRMACGLMVFVLLLVYPLHRALERSIERGKPQPRTYPLTFAVEEALTSHVNKTPEVELIASGRPSSAQRTADVVIVLASPYPLPLSYADGIVKVVHDEMEDDTLIVHVHCVQEAWYPDEPAVDPSENEMTESKQVEQKPLSEESAEGGAEGGQSSDDSAGKSDDQTDDREKKP